MSILLDALRKSEKDQQKVEPPNIHSGADRPVSAGFSRKGWVLLVIVVILTGASFAWYQYGKQEEGVKLPDPRTIEQGKVDSKQAEKPAESKPAVDKLAMVAGDVSNRQRTPVETLRSPAGAVADTKPPKPTNPQTQTPNKAAANKPAPNKAAANKPAPNKAAANKPAPNKAAAREAAVQKAAARKAAAREVAVKKAAARKAAAQKVLDDKAAARKAKAQKVAANRAAARKAAAEKAAANKQAANKVTPGKPAVGKPANTKPAAAGQKEFRPQPPALINYWELPDAIRAKVPEMKFTVLVYAEKPADRFVLINGQRYGQGEEVQPELFVRQIRREGVVFKYRLYEFLVDR